MNKCDTNHIQNVSLNTWATHRHPEQNSYNGLRLENVGNVEGHAKQEILFVMWLLLQKETHKFHSFASGYEKKWNYIWHTSTNKEILVWFWEARIRPTWETMDSRSIFWNFLRSTKPATTSEGTTSRSRKKSERSLAISVNEFWKIKREKKETSVTWIHLIF